MLIEDIISPGIRAYLVSLNPGIALSSNYDYDKDCLVISCCAHQRYLTVRELYLSGSWEWKVLEAVKAAVMDIAYTIATYEF